MGLNASLSNALSGLQTTQKSLEVLSRNVANAGTPGYHKQSVVLTEAFGGSSSYARYADTERAFVASLQRTYNGEVARTGYADVRASLLARMESVLGKPGDAGSLDTMYRDFESALAEVATSPDDYATRALAVTAALELADTLNGLSSDVQALRQEIEYQIESEVVTLNSSLATLADLNTRLSDPTVEKSARAAMLDERDRLVAGVSDLVDAQVVYRPNGTITLMTESGLSLLDEAATQFEYKPVGGLSASSKYSIVDSENGVGTLTAITPSGLSLDVFEQGLIRSGRLAGLAEMRDKTLPQMQGHLDEIAAGLAQALSRVDTEGTAVTVGAAEGYRVDTAGMLSGDTLTLDYTHSGIDKTVTVVRVDDATKLPMDYTGPNGERVIGADFSAGMAAVATTLDAALGNAVSVSNPAGNELQFVDDGATGRSNITSVTAHSTATSTQDGNLALPLFVDANGKPFSNSLDGENPQKRGFSNRIMVNKEILANNELLVKFAAGGSAGSSDRIDHMISQLNNVQFTPNRANAPEIGTYKLSGNLQSLISQVLNYQGNQISTANDALATRETALNSIQSRMDSEYAVNIDEEMARLIELQNAYSASARVMSAVQELIDTLLRV